MKKGYILNYRQAMQFIPEEPTLIIRIHDWETRDYQDARGEWDNSPKAPLIESPHWIGVLSYRFSDIDPCTYELYGQKDEADGMRRDFGTAGLKGERILGETLASRILKEFSALKDQATSYVFHCNAGASRSPAMALALNEIFDLHLVWTGRAASVVNRLKSRTWDSHHPSDIVGNLTVYNVLKETAQKMF